MAEQWTGIGLEDVWRLAQTYSALLLPVGGFLLVLLGLSRLFLGGTQPRTAPAAGNSAPTVSVFGRMTDALAKAFTTNWQLTLLAATALVLSLASGWTTWDGMRNFTGEPLLSFMITFGIQGVMLIIAWLIGESFATGMSQRSPAARVRSTGEWLAGLVVGTLLIVALIASVASATGIVDMKSMSRNGASWASLADKAIYLAAAILALATLLLNSRSELAQPYLQSARIMARTAVLWVMFLGCMATSVFFSFDSLFSSIFPASERKRAAEIRATRQVANIVSDVGALIQRRQGEEAERLFQSEGWRAFEQHLVALSKSSQGAEAEIERFFVRKMETHRASIKEQQERIVSAQSGTAGLAAKKITLTDELSRLRAERPTLSSELAKVKTELDERARGLDAKRVEAMAEERGAEGTLKIGKGPMYRERMGELARLQDAYKIQEERVRDANKRLATVDQRVAQLERELAAVDGEIAKLQGDAQTAETRIKLAEASRSGDEDGPKVDPARVRSAFERARGEFRQDPTIERLTQLTNQCTQLYNAMASTPATKDRMRGIDCDPKPATEASARVFALNAGVENFARNCAGGTKLPQGASTDELLGFGRRCLQDSGLPGADAGEMANLLAAIDLNRDDKAHRFVVTWNAFLDGNRLAYLALGIAIAIDSLVFMSGLFGATAVRSPLADVPGAKPRSASQLEAVVANALLPETYENARLVLDSMQADTSREGFVAEIDIGALRNDPEAMGRIQKLLTAGTTIGAVERDAVDRSRYHVRGELYEYLSIVAKRTFEQNRSRFTENIAENHKRAELERTLTVALLPREEVAFNADLLLAHLVPRDDPQATGFTSEIDISTVAKGERMRMLRVLNAGAAFSFVQPIWSIDRKTRIADQFYVHAELYKTLARIRARTLHYGQLASPQQPAAIAVAPPEPIADLPAQPLSVVPPEQITDGTQRQRLPAPERTTQSDDDETSASRRDSPVREARAQSVPPPLPAVRSADGRQSAHARPTQDDELSASLGHSIRDELLQIGGLFPWSARDIAIARTIAAGSEPEQALGRLASRGPRLALEVANAIADHRKSIDDAYEYLSAHHGHDAVYRQVLETVAAELSELLPVLIFVPKGPYQQILDRMVAELEPQAGDGLLSTADLVVLGQARRQIEALEDLSDSGPERQRKLGEIIDSYSESTAGSSIVIAGSMGGRRTLN